MSKIEYVPRQFIPSSLAIIQQANEIIGGYQAQGFTLTLRQLYYQFVARDLFPEDRRWKWLKDKRKWIRDLNGTKNAQPNYAWLSSIISDARLAGLIDWDAIEDRTRYLRRYTTWDSVSQIIRSCVYSYNLDKWENQQYRPEVWIEKDALIGVIEGVCGRHEVLHFSCRGYVSQSEMHNAAKRYIRYIKEDKQPIMFHLGDHDPSGIDMTNDIINRMGIFGADVEVKRLALNMNQVEEYNPPPNPAKLTDSRCQNYIAEYGTSNSWELDALEPSVIDRIIENAIKPLIDQDKLQEVLDKEEQGKDKLREISDNLNE